MKRAFTLISVAALALLLSFGCGDKEEEIQPTKPVVESTLKHDTIHRVISPSLACLDDINSLSELDSAVLHYGNINFVYENSVVIKPITKWIADLQGEFYHVTPGNDTTLVHLVLSKSTDLSASLWFFLWEYWWDPPKLDRTALVKYNPHSYIAYRYGVFFALKLDTLHQENTFQEDYDFAQKPGFEHLPCHWQIIGRLTREKARMYIESWDADRQDRLIATADSSWNSNYGYAAANRLYPSLLYNYIVRMGSGTGIDSLSGDHLWGWWIKGQRIPKSMQQVRGSGNIQEY